MNSSKDPALDDFDYNYDWLEGQLEYTYRSLRASQETTNIILTVFLTTVFLVGSTGNILVLIVFARSKTKQTATVFIMALATTDLTICLVVLPGVLIKEWFVPFRWDALCRGWELVRCATIPLSSLILAVVAVDRYIMICRVGRCKSISTQQAKWILVGIIMCSLGLGIPPMLRVGVYQQGPSPGNSSQYLGLCISNDFLISKATVDHYWQAMAAKFFLVLVAVVVLYSLIFRTIYRQGMWRPGGPQSSAKKKSSAKEPHGNSNRAENDTAEALGPGLENVTADVSLKPVPHERTNSSCDIDEHLPGSSCLTGQNVADRFRPPSSKLTQPCNVVINVSEAENCVLDAVTNLPIAETCGTSSANSSTQWDFKTNQQSSANVESMSALQNNTLNFPVINNSHLYPMPNNHHRDRILASYTLGPTDDQHESKLVCSQTDVLPESKLLCSQTDVLPESKLLCSQTDVLPESKLLCSQTDVLPESKLLFSQTDVLPESKLLCSQTDLLPESKLLCSQTDLLEESKLLCSQSNVLEESKLLCSQSNVLAESKLLCSQSNVLEESKLLCSQTDVLQESKILCNRTQTSDLKESNIYNKSNQATTECCFTNELKDEADKPKDLYEDSKTLQHIDHNLQDLQTIQNSELSLKDKGDSKEDNIFMILKTKVQHQGHVQECLTNFHAGTTRPSGHSKLFSLKCFCRNKVHPAHMANSVTLRPLGSDADHAKSLAASEPHLQYHISDARQRRMWTAQVKTAKVLLLVTVVYVLSFAPVLLMTLDAIPSHPIPFYGYFLHSAANPLIYSFININFRRQLMQLFKCKQFTE